MPDKCDFVIYIIDNSGSMEEVDGTTFIRDGNNVQKKDKMMRFQEVNNKIDFISTYNIERRVPSAYYILNPKSY